MDDLELCPVLPALKWSFPNPSQTQYLNLNMKDHPCVNLCCPHGTTLVEDPDYPTFGICGIETLNETFSPEFRTKHDGEVRERGRLHSESSSRKRSPVCVPRFAMDGSFAQLPCFSSQPLRCDTWWSSTRLQHNIPASKKNSPSSEWALRTCWMRQY